LGGQSYPASAKSDTRVRGLVIAASQFHQALDVSKGFRNYVLQSLTERLSDMISLVSSVVFRRLDLRLACLLGQQFERSGGQPLKITHAELARELGTTREVISRILKEFERQDCIALTRGEIHLISQDGLEWFQQAQEA
jgi:CRP/FNR family transcriptional regulator